MPAIVDNIFKADALVIGNSLKVFLESLGDKELQVTIHSIFNNVVNLNSCKGIISLVTSRVGNASSYIVVSEQAFGSFLSINIKKDEKSCLNCKRLNINNKMFVNLCNTKTWYSSIEKNLSWDIAQISHDNLVAFYNAVQRYSKESSAFFRIQKNDLDFKKRLDFLANKESLKNPLFHIKNLIGFGPGLTPTGDDLLLGFTLIVNSCRSYAKVKDKFKKELGFCLKYTSDFSGDVLNKAIEGEYHESLENLLLALIGQSPERVLLAAKELLSIGATSGTDIATGIYLGIVNA